MDSRAAILTLLFLIISSVYATDKNNESKKEDPGFIMALGDSLDLKLGEYANVFTRWLAKFNDEHFGNSELGKFFHYNEIKPKLEETGMRKFLLFISNKLQKYCHFLTGF